MLQEMAALGFSRVELSHGIRITLVPGILRAVEEGIATVTSTHNFCPLPTGVNQAAPNLFEPSTPDRREHEQWVRQTRRSLDFAAQVGARALVCHLGSVRRWWYHPTEKLARYRGERGALDAHGDAAYVACRDRILARLRAVGAGFWARTQASLAEVVDYAAEKGVRLGLENREKLEELPLDDAFPALFAASDLARVGYWHDTGHAQIKHDLGVIDHRQQLERNAGALWGFHLHDVDDSGRDHQAVGSGHVDFPMVSRYFRPGQNFVLELSPRLTADEVVRSRTRLEALLPAAA